MLKKSKQSDQTRRRKIIIVSIIVIGIAILVAEAAYLRYLKIPKEKQSGGNNSAVTQDANSVPQTPEGSNIMIGELWASETVHDFGKISSKDEVETTFVLENRGNNEIKLSNFASSCGCTSLIVAKGDSKSPDLSKPGSREWTATLSPGEKASITTVFDADFHKITGSVERTISFNTSDSVASFVTLKLKMEVE